MIRDNEVVEIQTKENKHIMWMVNDSCPFKCWYCPEDTWGGSPKPTYTWDECSEALDVICKHYGRGYFILTGGEPTDWPYYTRVLEKLHNNPYWSAMTVTNLSKKMDFIDKYVDMNVGICASYHPNIIKTDTQRKIWLDKLMAVKDRTLMQIRILMDPKHFDHCLNLYNTLNDASLFVEPVRVSNFIDGYKPTGVGEVDYTDDQKSIMDRLISKVGLIYEKKARKDPIQTTFKYSSGESDTYKSNDAWAAITSYNAQRRNKFKGWACEIGLENLYIDPLGNVAKSVCKGARKQFISTFKDIKQTVWPDKPTLCEYDWCFCEPEMLITKKKL